MKPDELKVRWACDEARRKSRDRERNGGKSPAQEFDVYASALREETPRLLNIKACRLGQKVVRGDWVSAFLHVDSGKFWTYYPDGIDESEGGEYGNGVG